MHRQPAPATGDATTPELLVRLDAVRANARTVVESFDGRVLGVTKAVCGDPRVAGAMLEGGVDGLADSRLRNLTRLRAETDAELTLLRGPGPSAVEGVVATADRSLNSELAVVRALGAAARHEGVVHDVVLMVDIGDRREGVLPADAVEAAAQVADCEGVRLVGLGTNVGCFGGVVPTGGSMRSFVDLVERAEAVLDREFATVSGGSTVTLSLVEAGTLPERVDELRIGEGILLGTDVTGDREVPGLHTGAFELRAEVIECKRKPSTPSGPRGNDVDGEQPTFADRGERTRAILALGKQDATLSALSPVEEGVELLGGSSDHAVLDVTDAERSVDVGDTLAFSLSYRALVDACTSEYVTRRYVTE